MAGSTKIIIANSGQEYSLPGTHWTAVQVTSTFSDNVPGLSSMQVDRSEENGDVVYTYRPRTGTKG
jgi:hypothetical protein